MSERAEKSGFAKEAFDRVMSKYDPNQAQEALEWIKELIEEDFDTNGSFENFRAQLRDGSKLCKLMNKLTPGKISKINGGTMAFKLMENIGNFVQGCRDYGLPDSETFQTVDLWDENGNLHQVCLSIHALGRKAQKNGLKGLGPKEATANVRTFTEEQLKEGAKYTSLQYGTNKLATQSGTNYGNTRHI